jgi:hypothetical protein
MSTPTIEQTDPAPRSVSSADEELSAIQAVLNALTGLQPEARQRVIDYVFQRLDLTSRPSAPAVATTLAPAPTVEPIVGLLAAPTPIRDIRSLKDQKKPRTAVEMVALVAYYLSELAPDGSRKSEIGTDDITTYFKQAGFPLPATPRQALFNAKAAGYLDAAAHGAYKLNPVGHNLVAHGLPAARADAPAKKRGKRAQKKGIKRGRR